MELNRNKTNKLTKHRNMFDPIEWERILMQYQGIFRNQIREYTKLNKTIKKPQKNYSE